MARPGSRGGALNEIAQTYPQLAVQLVGAGWTPADLATVRRAYDLAATMFAGHVRGSGKPFTAHLVGTASCLLLDGAPPATVAAGLLHAAYEQGDFGDRATGPTPAHVARLRTAVGAPVEEIVAAYFRLGWDRDVARRTAATIGDLPPEVRAALRVRLANEVDEVLDGGMVISGKASLFGADAVPTEVVLDLAAQVAGPGFVACARAVLTAPQPVIPPELMMNGGFSSVRLPPSAMLRDDRWPRSALRWMRRRVPAPLKRAVRAARTGRRPRP
jgi:hypothetical protein